MSKRRPAASSAPDLSFMLATTLHTARPCPGRFAFARSAGAGLETRESALHLKNTGRVPGARVQKAPDLLAADLARFYKRITDAGDLRSEFPPGLYAQQHMNERP
ncbi:hypothetical protein AZF01_16945 [Martelella sp. AD-3]|nr:hypothetical protein AZF01_16945 [Martelella sp. AD-3]MAM11220.1 hypothetical protein [Rhizobiaceae bacterium]